MSPRPLVTILVPNYNYGKYLPACLDSALRQSYENVQVVFVDNHSTDDSYDIALDFRARYGDRLRVFRNDQNYGGSLNCTIAYDRMDPRTEYLIYLSSDDLFHPSLIERSMGIVKEHPSVGFVLFHRNAIDEADRITEEMPFYNCDCVIPSTSQMEVFMMAGIGVSTQCLRNKFVESAGPIRGYRFDIAGDWFSNFALACESDMGYLKEPLCSYRTHSNNVTNQAIRNLTNSVEHLLMLHAFDHIAESLERPSVRARMRPASEKLGTMCLRYCTQLLRENDPRTAKRYLHLAPVLRPDITDDPVWQALWRLSQLDHRECLSGLETLEARMPQKRLVSYDPPVDAIRL